MSDEFKNLTPEHVSAIAEILGKDDPMIVWLEHYISLPDIDAHRMTQCKECQKAFRFLHQKGYIDTDDAFINMILQNYELG